MCQKEEEGSLRTFRAPIPCIKVEDPFCFSSYIKCLYSASPFSAIQCYGLPEGAGLREIGREKSICWNYDKKSENTTWQVKQYLESVAKEQGFLFVFLMTPSEHICLRFKPV